MPIRYFISSAVLEALVLAPVAISRFSHAGPNGGILGLISFLLNYPGIICVGWLSGYWDFSWPGFVIAVFLVQTGFLWLFGLFVLWLKRRRAVA